jgi:hypothetical protein
MLSYLGINKTAIRIGEFRPPKKGEYYLSGAIPMAYKAPNDLSTSYHICKLARISKQYPETVFIID